MDLTRVRGCATVYAFTPVGIVHRHVTVELLVLHPDTRAAFPLLPVAPFHFVSAFPSPN